MTEPLFPVKAGGKKIQYAIELDLSKSLWRSEKVIVISEDFNAIAFKFRYLTPMSPFTTLKGAWLRPHDKAVRFEATVTRCAADPNGRFFDITARFVTPLSIAIAS